MLRNWNWQGLIPKESWVIVTGGATRLGELFVHTMAQKGFNVVVHFGASENAAKSLVQTVQKQYGVRAESTQWDFSGWDEAVITKWEQISNKNVVGLINNASVYRTGNWLSASVADFYTTLQINVFVPMQLGIWMMNVSEQGWIINILDAGSDMFCKEYQNYYISKKMLEQFTKNQAQLFAPRIRVNGIAPGPVLPAVLGDGVRFAEQIEQTPLRKKISLSEMAAAVNFLIDTEAITGQILYVDSGLHLNI